MGAASASSGAVALFIVVAAPGWHLRRSVPVRNRAKSFPVTLAGCGLLGEVGTVPDGKIDVVALGVPSPKPGRPIDAFVGTIPPHPTLIFRRHPPLDFEPARTTRLA
ncbi:MAG: hypothetical protein H6667_17965 [Ardenticatenaceae bacterium]|nr:hypothetical protein [Ardenticatenaceae bacterium]